MRTISSGEPAAQIPWAALAPLACVIHCLATPLLLVILPIQVEHRGVEITFAAVASAIGLVVVKRGYQIHGHRRVLALVIIGLTLWSVALLELIPFGTERTWSPIAGLLVASGMFWDSRLRTHCSMDHKH